MIEELDNIKMVMFVLLAGKSEGEKLANYLAFLADKCGLAEKNDFILPSEYSATGMFINKSMDLLEEDRYDDWIEYFKNELLKEQSYELINELHL